MKTIKIIAVALFVIALGFTSNANTPSTTQAGAAKTETLKVSGKCGYCKSRIEKAAKIDGVTKAEWSSDSQSLAVTYDASKANLDKIGKSVAAVGHDNAKAKSDDKVYTALPGCCKYK